MSASMPVDRAGRSGAVGGWRSITSIPWLVPVGLSAAVVTILALAVAVDPAAGVTRSGSPFADEGFNAVNARNLVLLGRWSTDSWNLYLVDLPYSALLAVAFQLVGVGIIQARLVSIGAVGLTIAILALGLRRPFGAAPAALAALALGTAGLILFYGRLVYQEDVVALFLVAGVVVLVGAAGSGSRWRALGAGVLLALAIGSKPSAAFAVGGVLIALAIVGWRSPATRWTVAIAAATIASAGLAWVVFIWLPDRAAVAAVMRIWPQFDWPDSAGALLRRIGSYAVRNDGALLLSLPLAVGGTVGLVAAVARRSELRGTARLMTAAAFGWFVGGFGVLAVASYRPNRYVVPLLPSAAILLAVAVFLVGPWVRARLPRPARPVAAALLCVLIAGPGLAADASWVVGAPATAPAIQAAMAPLVPAGSIVVGVDSALFLMRAPVITIIPWRGVPGNEGDLYRTAGARWFLWNGEVPPPTVTIPAAAWAARERVGCAHWFGTLECLYRVP